MIADHVTQKSYFQEHWIFPWNIIKFYVWINVILCKCNNFKGLTISLKILTEKDKIDFISISLFSVSYLNIWSLIWYLISISFDISISGFLEVHFGWGRKNGIDVDLSEINLLIALTEQLQHIICFYQSLVKLLSNINKFSLSHVIGFKNSVFT